MTNWREHLRAVAIIANVLLMMFMVGTKAWWLSMGLGFPLILAPILAILALVLIRRR